MADDKVEKEVDGEKKTTTKAKRGFWSRIWNGLFRSHGGDFEKRLQHISKEEATLLARMKRRSSSWRSTARNIIVISVLLEVGALGYAIVTTRTAGLDWQMRALRVLPIFLLPALSSALYWALFSFTKMRDSRDQKTVDRLRAERQAKIDELKERTNYYITQQLIQKYDPDPAAKAAAASVLASKLGADSGLKVHLGDEFQQHSPTGKSHDVDPVTSTGLRKRNTSEAASKGGNDMEMTQHIENEIMTHNELVVEHHNPATYGSQDGGWLARLAQLLVGEDPSQSYALICGNCHMHNGLARKEDFPFITYYCPRCHALNRPRNSGPYTPSTSTLTSPTMQAADLNLIKQNSGSTTSSPPADPGHTSEKVSPTSSPVADTVDMSEKVSHVGEVEASEKIVTEDSSSQ
ncbi:lunapark domain-containing protein [Artemisia annua]|uniref:Lunapark domain-containing protein n=1 Tax=Artemisia annua TaxID=35608 RepID=A0A2U1QAI4_ARTAN|nr:lunapark domain-containing protein [Artemisia annua]